MNAALFHDAKAGSFTALAQLGVLAHENENIFRRLLPVILGHLNSHPVPKSSFPQAQTEAEIYSLIPLFDAVAAEIVNWGGTRTYRKNDTVPKRAGANDSQGTVT
ncbi:hypothetical protein C8J56DRAFT_883212 [Mycena floridula]|nr:hypothetical protein C8J56DRAFT_883212 [Mycena floridula]